MKKRIASIAIALTMCLTMLPAAAWAAESSSGLDFTDAAEDASGAGYTWDNANKTLTLEGLSLDVTSGAAITLPGGSKVVLKGGKNTIATAAGSILVSQGSLTVTGEGEGAALVGTSNGKSDAYHGIQTNGGNLTISGCSLNLGITPDSVSEVITTAEYNESGKGLDKGGDFLLTNGAYVYAHDENFRCWGLCTGEYGVYGDYRNDCGDIQIDEGCTLTVRGLQGFFVRKGSNVTINGTLDTTNCDPESISANVLTYDSLTINGTVKMAEGTYMDTRCTTLNINAKDGSTGIIHNSELPANWWLSSSRGFRTTSFASYCNRGLKKLFVAKSAILTIIPTGEITETKLNYWGELTTTTVNQTLKLNPASLDDLKSEGYVKVEEGGVVELTLADVTAEQVQDLDLFCGKVSVNGTEATFHAGGTATCLAKAVCAVCGTEYGELADHDLGTLIPEQAATTSAPGMKAHYVCSTCGTYFDEDQNETTAEALTIPQLDGGSSDSDDEPTYPVTAPSKPENGNVSVTPRNAEAGDTVTITVTPDSGYRLGDLTVTDTKGESLKLTDQGSGRYTFTMPGRGVEIKTSFVKAGTSFRDVDSDDYYYTPVEWAVERGITSGVTDDLFGPDQSCTRAQIITFLWRAAGSPEVNCTMPFADVPEEAWFAEAVRWAVSGGIAAGTSATTFSPYDTCTRGQSVTFLYKVMGSSTKAAGSFTDVSADAWYVAAVDWAAAKGVTSGVGPAVFGPELNCTRAQIITFLFRAVQAS